LAEKIIIFTKFLFTQIKNMTHLKTASDKKLVQLIRKSNSHAFKIFYFRYYGAIYRFLWYRTNSVEMAKDYTQEVFTRIWEKCQQLDPNRSIKAYLYRIAYNLVVDNLKKRAIRESAIIEISKSHDGSFEDFTNLQIDIHNIIRQFPEPIKEVFCLSRFDGLKYNEISEICGVSVKTVEYRISQALEIFRKKLGDSQSKSY
jgi:RNA polymerase sigma-70 factor (ECF subfamily)